MYGGDKLGFKSLETLGDISPYLAVSFEDRVGIAYLKLSPGDIGSSAQTYLNGHVLI